MTQPRGGAVQQGGSSRWPMAAGGAALVVLAGLAGFLLLRPSAPVASGSPTPTVEPSPTFNAELLSNRLTVLLLGLDSDERRRNLGKGVLSDTIMLASVNADQSEVTLISVPRDIVDFPLADGSTWTRKLNSIYAQDGPQGMVGALEGLLQVEVDGYVQIDMGDFKLMADAVNGVTVNPKAPLFDEHLDLDMAPGRQHVDGETALDYVRTRVDSDYARAARQQEVLPKVVRRLVAPDADVDIPQLLDRFFSFETDLPLEDLPTLIEVARRAQDADLTRQVFNPQDGFIVREGDFGDGRGYISIPDIEAMRAFAARHLVD